MEEYAEVLSKKPDLTLLEIILLDKIKKSVQLNFQKKIKSLRYRGLIEGNAPNLIISAVVAVKTKQVGNYLKNRLEYSAETYKSTPVNLFQSFLF